MTGGERGCHVVLDVVDSDAQRGTRHRAVSNTVLHNCVESGVIGCDIARLLKCSSS